jgi:hypothetical protein
MHRIQVRVAAGNFPDTQLYSASRSSCRVKDLAVIAADAGAAANTVGEVNRLALRVNHIPQKSSVLPLLDFVAFQFWQDRASIDDSLLRRDHVLFVARDI